MEIPISSLLPLLERYSGMAMAVVDAPASPLPSAAAMVTGSAVDRAVNEDPTGAPTATDRPADADVDNRR